MPEPQPVELLVIGGGPAGHHAVRAYREAGGAGTVALVSADDAAPYHRPPLSKDYLRGEADDEDLPIEAESWYADNDIDLVLNSSVEELEPAARIARAGAGERWRFRACVVATGSEPLVPELPGTEHPDVHYLRSMDDGKRLRERATAAGSAVVIGSGFIGCEAAASLAMRGLTVTLVTDEDLPQQDRLGYWAGERIKGWLRDVGVQFRGGVELLSIVDGHRVSLSDGHDVDADLVLCALGIRPRSDLAERAGLTIHGGRVPVDAAMQSEVAGLFFAGDVALAVNATAGRRLVVEHWGEAERMGSIAGTVAAGGRAEWAEVPGFWSEIGTHTLKYAAWGDGYDEVVPVPDRDGAFTVWYGRDDRVVGVLTHDNDADYEQGTALVRRGGPVPAG